MESSDWPTVMPTTHLIAVGAVACDVILGVPFYPGEDSKLRATSCNKRRGGNVGNTLEVLQRLLANQDQRGTTSKVQLSLVAALPRSTSPCIDFIASSFGGNSDNGSAGDSPIVGMQHCLYRDAYQEPVTSYIVSSEANSSRTIVNHNPLPEMTFAEFRQIADRILSTTATSSMGGEASRVWFHFEGRIPEVTLECVSYLRAHHVFRAREVEEGTAANHLTISVEVEKPGREGLQALAHSADVVFYSRSWAEGQGYGTAEDCLRRQEEILRVSPTFQPYAISRLLVCTWGAGGAWGLQSSRLQKDESDNVTDASAIVHSPAYRVDGARVVDTTGAGDTFIAGMLFRLLQHRKSTAFSDITHFGLFHDQGNLRASLDYANSLAGRKILQQGFSGVG